MMMRLTNFLITFLSSAAAAAERLRVWMKKKFKKVIFFQQGLRHSWYKIANIFL